MSTTFGDVGARVLVQFKHEDGSEYRIIKSGTLSHIEQRGEEGVWMLVPYNSNVATAIFQVGFNHVYKRLAPEGAVFLIAYD